MKSKISIIGHFAKGKNLLNGQTVKTKIIADELKTRFGDCEVKTYDTHGALALIKAPFQIMSAMWSSKNVIMLPAHNGIRVITPLLRFFSKIFKGRGLYYAVVGGWLPEFLQDKPGLLKWLGKFDGILVETRAMREALVALGLKNVFVMPNCKRLEVLSPSELKANYEPPLRLCTFSRVMREKGIEEAVNATVLANERIGKTAFTLDVYGQIDANQTAWFAELEARFPSYVNYRGIVPYNGSTKVLSDYFALLFPTYYEGEGMAGTVIDAMAAGVPVIASEWRYNSELIESGANGILVPTRNTGALADALAQIYESPDDWNSKREACLSEARKYTPEVALENLISILK